MTLLGCGTRSAGQLQKPIVHPAVQGTVAVGFARQGVREGSTSRKGVLGEAEHHISDRSLAVAREVFPGSGKTPLAGPLRFDAGAADRVARPIASGRF